MYLLKKYLPKINLISNVTVVNSLEEWEKIKDRFPERVISRTDNIIGEPPVRISGASGKKEDIPRYLEQIKTQNPNSVMLLIEGDLPSYRRYENLGGFLVAFALNEDVTLSFVGKGFDGRELTRGIAEHEGYMIPWSEVLWIKNRNDLLKNKFVQCHRVDDEEYKKSRQERIKFLVEDAKEDKEIVETKIPLSYKPIDDNVIEDIIENVVIPLYSRNTDLHYDGLRSFKVQGNISNTGRIDSFEITTPERFLIKNKKIEKTKEDETR